MFNPANYPPMRTCLFSPSAHAYMHSYTEKYCQECTRRLVQFIIIRANRA